MWVGRSANVIRVPSADDGVQLHVHANTLISMDAPAYRYKMFPYLLSCNTQDEPRDEPQGISTINSLYPGTAKTVVRKMVKSCVSIEGSTHAFRTKAAPRLIPQFQRKANRLYRL
jgi:hypothetical protein